MRRLLVLLAVLANAPGQTVPSGNGFSRALTIHHEKVLRDQNDFHLWVAGIYPFLKTEANGGRVHDIHGFDIWFGANITCSDRYDFEIQTWNPVSGHIGAWVHLPFVSRTTDTALFLCYGNVTRNSNQSSPVNSWRNYKKGDRLRVASNKSPRAAGRSRVFLTKRNQVVGRHLEDGAMSSDSSEWFDTP